MKEEKPLSEEKKEILRSLIKHKNYNCSNCFDCSYKIKNFQFTKEEYKKFKKGEYTEEDLK